MSALHGELIRLRARQESDTATLHVELHDDVHTSVRAGRAPWRPVPPDVQRSQYRPIESNAAQASFAVVELATDRLAGTAGLWGIDAHNRSAHLGLSLRPLCRGKGLGTDIVHVLCYYGFTVLGLHRLQIDTLADNHAMITAAERAGFTRETRIRQCAWALGGFVDEIVLGLLAGDWKAAHDSAG